MLNERKVMRILPGIFILIFLVSSAQICAAGAYKIGIGGGYGYNNVIETGDLKWQNDGIYRFEISIEKGLSPYISLETGLYYTDSSSKLTADFGSDESTSRMKVDVSTQYLQLPIIFKPHIPFRYVDIAFPIGLSFGYLLNSEMSAAGKTNDIQEYIENNQISAVSGVELSILFAFNVDYYIAATAELYLFDLVKSGDKDEQKDSSYLYSFIARSGFRYRFF